MNRILKVPLYFTIVACSPIPKYPVPEPLQAFVEKFQEYVGYKFDDIEYSFYDSKTTQIGFCSIIGNYKSVSIDNYYWNTSSDLGKEQLVFHELGHCVLKRQHNKEFIANHPVSIMYPLILSDRLYSKYYDSYIEELFK